MFKAVDELIDEMKLREDDNKEEWIPDIFQISSNILIEIMNYFQIKIPNELHTFTWFDYMGDAVISEKSTNIIIEEYIHNSDIFTIIPKKNELEIDFSCYDDVDAKKKQKILHDELPADVECKIVGTKAIMKLDAIQSFTAINFKKRSFWRQIFH